MTDPDSPTVPDNGEPLNDSAPLAALRDLDEAGNELSLGEIALGQDGELVLARARMSYNLPIQLARDHI